MNMPKLRVTDLVIFLAILSIKVKLKQTFFNLVNEYLAFTLKY